MLTKASAAGWGYGVFSTLTSTGKTWKPCFRIAKSAEETSALDADERIIVETIGQLQSVGRGRYGWDILLPAEFYRAVARKDTGNLLQFWPTDEQILAGLHLFRGRVVEMNAGEGKTVAVAFPAIMHAVLGRAVHIVTANDYLAARDCNLLAPVYRSLGLDVDAVLGHMDGAERRDAYAKQIVYIARCGSLDLTSCGTTWLRQRSDRFSRPSRLP